MRRAPSRHLSDESDKSDESDDALSYRTSRTSQTGRTGRTARYHIGRVGQVGRVGRRAIISDESDKSDESDGAASPSPTPPCRDWWERAGGRLLSRRPGRAPRRGARSIGIGHPRSGDRCAAPHPLPHDPLRVAEQATTSRRPARGRAMMCAPIHRSSAHRASTDAYGTGILADAGVLSEPVYWGWSSDSSDEGTTPGVTRSDPPTSPPLPGGSGV